jgi:hypothetical protein
MMRSAQMFRWATNVMCALQEALCAPFLQAGFACRDVHVHARTVVNRRSSTTMDRRWIQATFCLPPGPSEELILPQPQSKLLACDHILTVDMDTECHDGTPDPVGSAGPGWMRSALELSSWPPLPSTVPCNPDPHLLVRLRLCCWVHAAPACHPSRAWLQVASSVYANPAGVPPEASELALAAWLFQTPLNRQRCGAIVELHSVSILFAWVCRHDVRMSFLR